MRRCIECDQPMPEWETGRCQSCFQKERERVRERAGAGFRLIAPAPKDEAVAENVASEHFYVLETVRRDRITARIPTAKELDTICVNGWQVTEDWGLDV